MCMSELLDCFLVAKLMIARGTPFEIGLIIRLESWLRNGRDHARTGRSGQSFFRENYLWRSCRDGFLNFIMKIKLSFLCMFSILETQLA